MAHVPQLQKSGAECQTQVVTTFHNRRGFWETKEYFPTRIYSWFGKISGETKAWSDNQIFQRKFYLKVKDAFQKEMLKISQWWEMKVSITCNWTLLQLPNS